MFTFWWQLTRRENVPCLEALLDSQSIIRMHARKSWNLFAMVAVRSPIRISVLSASNAFYHILNRMLLREPPTELGSFPQNILVSKCVKPKGHLMFHSVKKIFFHSMFASLLLFLQHHHSSSKNCTAKFQKVLQCPWPPFWDSSLGREVLGSSM